MTKKPYIVVGFGIAGATIAWQLYLQKIPFIVIAEPKNTCSRAAAGLINPIIFRKFNMSYRASDLLPAADAFYDTVEKLLKQPIRRHHPIVKIFNSIEDENNWMVKKTTSPYKQYFGDIQKLDFPSIDNPFGTGYVNTIGHLNTSLYIDASKIFFKDNNVEFVEDTFDHSKIEGNEYLNWSFTTIIFCEGYGIKQNPFFNYLPLDGTHGDTIIIKTKDFNFDGVLNKNMYVLPLGNQLYKVGASYNWDKKEAEITDAGRNNLIERLRVFAHFEFEIVDQQAGIRPTVKDRRPLAGRHHIHQQLAIFNGMGTKGVMLAPFFAKHLLDNLIKESPLNDEVDIRRFEKYLP